MEPLERSSPRLTIRLQELAFYFQAAVKRDICTLECHTFLRLHCSHFLT